MNKLKLYWTLQIGGWMMFSLIQIVGFSLLGDTVISNVQSLFWFLEGVIFLFITHAFRHFIIYKNWFVFALPKLIPRVLLAIFILSVAVYFIRLMVAYALGMYQSEIVWNWSNIIGLSSVYSLIIFLWAILYFIFHYFERYNTSLKHDAAVNEIQLIHLKSQLNPHFIFNALNSIRALVDEDPKKSKHAITQLSNILRNSLISDKHKLTNFSEELKIVKDYLSLETVRFEERLKTEYDIHPYSNDFQVPPLMLQTLVENGVKHGISKLKEGGTIKILTNVVDENFVIQVRNSGTVKLNGESNNKSGLGLKNTIKRLKLIYGESALLTIRNEQKNTVLTELILPPYPYESDNN